MQKLTLLLAAGGFAFAAILPCSAFARANTYVNAETGSNSRTCPVNAPCKTLNYALKQTNTGGTVYIVSAGVFGPIRITSPVDIIGPSDASAKIVANSSVASGCVGAAPGSCGGNSGYAVTVHVGANDVVTINHVTMTAGAAKGALLETTGGYLNLAHDIYRGNNTSTQPTVYLEPNIGGNLAHVTMSDSDAGYAHTYAVALAPRGSTSAVLEISQLAVHDASTTGLAINNSGTSGTTDVSIRDSRFFQCYEGIQGDSNTAYMHLYVTRSQFAHNSGSGAFLYGSTATASAVLNNDAFLGNDIGVGLSGPSTAVSLSRNTISGNSDGVYISSSGGGTVTTFGNNAFSNNSVDVSGSMTLVGLK